ncbi:SRPBCC family protein [Streptomyces sp. NPDC051921]|uniref:SRPBCC family protein n=1 Tax=Streptomyces sp. NPDC051921 TaxID=3155806 RepID=UPI003442B2BD
MVHDTIEVEAPLRQVYDQWTQFEEFPRFMDGVEEVRQVDDRLCHWRTKVAGVTREFDTEIVDQLPDERISWRTVGGDVRQKGVVTFRRVDDAHTRVSLAMDVEPQSLTDRAGAALGMVDSRVQGDLYRFKTFMEDRGRATGGWRGRLRPGDAPPETPDAPAETPASAAAPAPSEPPAPPVSSAPPASSGNPPPDPVPPGHM